MRRGTYAGIYVLLLLFVFSVFLMAEPATVAQSMGDDNSVWGILIEHAKSGALSVVLAVLFVGTRLHKALKPAISALLNRAEEHDAMYEEYCIRHGLPWRRHLGRGGTGQHAEDEG